jgi:hypothetical protein
LHVTPRLLAASLWFCCGFRWRRRSSAARLSYGWFGYGRLDYGWFSHGWLSRGWLSRGCFGRWRCVLRILRGRRDDLGACRGWRCLRGRRQRFGGGDRLPRVAARGQPRHAARLCIGALHQPADRRGRRQGHHCGQHQVAPCRCGQSAAADAVEQEEIETGQRGGDGQPARHIIEGRLFEARLADEVAQHAGKTGKAQCVDDHANRTHVEVDAAVTQHIVEIGHGRHAQPCGHGIDDAIHPLVELRVGEDQEAHHQIDRPHAQEADDQDFAEELGPPEIEHPAFDVKDDIQHQLIERDRHEQPGQIDRNHEFLWLWFGVVGAVENGEPDGGGDHTEDDAEYDESGVVEVVPQIRQE